MFAKENGKRLSNGSYTGAIGMVVNRKAHALVRSVDYYLDSDLIDFSLSVKSELYVTAEYLDVTSSDLDQSFYSLLKILSPLILFFIEFLFLTLLSFVILYLFLYCIHKNDKKSNLISKSINLLFGFKNKKQFFERPNAIGLFLISFLILESFVQNIIQNNINANGVVVDTSFLTTSTEKLLNSKKKVCFIEAGPEVDFFKFAPPNTLPNKIYTQLNFASYECFLFKDKKINFRPYDLDTFFCLMYLDGLKTILGLAKNTNSKNVFVNDKPLFEVLRAVALRKGLSKEIRRYLDNW